ncbi:MAG: hypothetical protein IJI24_03240, partial [Lachnospiraceae bacterium]|nr:hypothetical protein [Lachnospiraceae bacterium]
MTEAETFFTEVQHAVQRGVFRKISARCIPAAEGPEKRKGECMNILKKSLSLLLILCMTAALIP